MQRTIATDEARHAELAWDILEWTLAVQPEATRATLGGLDAPATSAPASTAAPGPALERFGILGSSRVHAVEAEQRARARARLAARLAV
jgi:hypothetical protein